MMKYILTVMMGLLVGCGSASNKNSKVEVTTKEVTYMVGKEKHIGYVAMPANLKEKAPGVLIVHEWWGQTEYPRRRARMLAELGYVAMAVDMYGDRKIAEHPNDAKKFASQTMSDVKAVANSFKMAMDQLKSMDEVDSDEIAAIGYCFGGGVVLEAAKQGLPLEAVVTFHGSLATPTVPKKDQVQADLLVINGAADSFISAEAIETFKKRMKAADANYEFVNLEGARHGFTNPEATANGEKYKIPLAYDKKADEKSWEMMKQFLAKNLD